MCCWCYFCNYLFLKCETNGTFVRSDLRANEHQNAGNSISHGNFSYFVTGYCRRNIVRRSVGVDVNVHVDDESWDLRMKPIIDKTSLSLSSLRVHEVGDRNHSLYVNIHKVLIENLSPLYFLSIFFPFYYKNVYFSSLKLSTKPFHFTRFPRAFCSIKFTSFCFLFWKFFFQNLKKKTELIRKRVFFM